MPAIIPSAVKLSLVLCLTLSTLTSYALTSNTQPNIILISADDLGFDDLAVNGNPVVTTPNIDLLAQQSVKFSDFNVSPVCATTRASLLTGRQFYRTGVSGVHGGRDYLKRDETLLPKMLKQQGYATGTWGKWHLGKSAGYMPWDRGFDEAYYAELYQHQANTGWLNGERVEHQTWVSQVITDYAIDFIHAKGQQKQPFFAYLSFLAPHEPWLAPDEFVAPYLEQGMRPAMANLYAMVSEMDYHIGRLLKALEQQGLSDNTIVIFISDNGPWWDSSNLGALTKQEWQTRNPSKLKGNKGQTWQNGIKSPLFVRLADTKQQHTVTRYVEVSDLLPTILELTGTALPATNLPIDGLSFVDYLNGNTDGINPRKHLIASHDLHSDKSLFNQWTPVDALAKAKIDFANQLIAYRTEDYKLILNPAMDRADYPLPQNHYLLFDMQNDPLETVNIIKQKPLIAQQLIAELQNEFNRIINEPHSLRPPVFTVVQQDISVINAFAPAATRGNTKSTAHFLSGMSHHNDSVSYDLDVVKAGTYQLYVEQLNTDAAGLVVQVSSTNTSLSTELNGDLVQKLGNIDLPVGLSQLELSILSSNSIKPWAQVSKLRRIYLLEANSKLSNDELTRYGSLLPQ